MKMDFKTLKFHFGTYGTIISLCEILDVHSIQKTEFFYRWIDTSVYYLKTK